MLGEITTILDLGQNGGWYGVFFFRVVYFLLEIIYLDLGFYILSGVFDMVNLVFGLGFTELAPLLLAQVYKPLVKTC